MESDNGLQYLRLFRKPRVRQIAYTKCKCTPTNLLCIPRLRKPYKGLYANIIYPYFLTSSLTLISSLVENYFIYLYLCLSVLLFICIFWPECLDNFSWSNFLYQFSLDGLHFNSLNRNGISSCVISGNNVKMESRLHVKISSC